MSEDVYTISIEIPPILLGKGSIWPDGDGPTDPTSEDVIKLIEENYNSLGHFFDDWSLGRDASIKVTRVHFVEETDSAKLEHGLGL